MEDDRVAILESQLAQAKQIAEEADKKYEEVQKHRQSYFTTLFIYLPTEEYGCFNSPNATRRCFRFIISRVYFYITYIFVYFLKSSLIFRWLLLRYYGVILFRAVSMSLLFQGKGFLFYSRKFQGYARCKPRLLRGITLFMLYSLCLGNKVIYVRYGIVVE